MNIPLLNITISKTADGLHDYMQITSDDQFALNIVLIADKIEVQDARQPAAKPPRTRNKSAKKS